MIDLPAFFALDAAVVASGFALLALGISRAPGWRAYRWLALALVGATGFALAYAVMSLPVPEWVVLAGPHATMVFAAIHAAGQLRLVAELERRELPRFDRIVMALLVISVALALWPGLSHRAVATAQRVDWLHLTYRFAEPGPLAPVVFGTLLIAHALVAWRALRADTLGPVGRRALVAALLTTVLFGVFDAATALQLWGAPYLLSVPVFVLTSVAGLQLGFHFVEQSIRAEALARDLGSEVQARTDELARTVAAITTAERQAALGRLASDVSTALVPAVDALGHALDGRATDDAGLALRRITGSVRSLQQATATLGRDVRVRPAVPLLAVVQEELERLRGSGALERPTRVELDEGLAANVEGALAGPLIASLLGEALARLPPDGRAALTVRGRRTGARLELDVGGLEESVVIALQAALRGEAPSLGAGLPLPIARAIARLDGAELRAELDPVIGATLRLFLRPAGVD